MFSLLFGELLFGNVLRYGKQVKWAAVLIPNRNFSGVQEPSPFFSGVDRLLGNVDEPARCESVPIGCRKEVGLALRKEIVVALAQQFFPFETEKLLCCA